MPVKIEKSLLKHGIGDWGNPKLIGDWGKKGREAEAIAIKKGPKVKRHPDDKPKPKEKEVRIEMLRDHKASLDGMNEKNFLNGEEYDIPQSCADIFIKRKWAKKVQKNKEVKK